MVWQKWIIEELPLLTTRLDKHDRVFWHLIRSESTLGKLRFTRYQTTRPCLTGHPVEALTTREKKQL